jgi:CBS domain containing-hemolysin-like protein
MTPGVVILGLFAGGLLFSAFFSGSETGFYRASRLRMVLDARGGDWIARGLVWLANNPVLFVATTLIGNNLANYLISRSVVMASERVFTAGGVLVDVAASVVVSPFIFLYGELVPKYLFFHAPNRLLRAAGPLFLLCVLLFLPVVSVMWLFNRLLQYLVGEPPERTRLTLARNELQRMMDEGHAAGILFRAQRQLIHGMFALGNQPLTRFAVPVARLPVVRRHAPRNEMLRAARRFRASTVLLADGLMRDPGAYVRVADLYLSGDQGPAVILPLMAINFRETPIGALHRLQNENQSLARVVDDYGRTLGVLNDQTLVEQLLARSGT